MKNQDKKILLFVITTIVTSIGIISSLFKGTYSEIVIADDYNANFSCENTIINDRELECNIISKTDSFRMIENIEITNGSLDKKFNKSIFEYGVITDDNKIVINVILSNKDIVVIKKELQYGTNDIRIIVPGESIDNNKIYNFNIFRKYKINNDKYLYNEKDGYLYVGDKIDDFINSLVLEDGLEKEIENNRLIINNLNEKILDINILSISFDNYKLIDDVLYVDKKININEFAANVEYSDGIMFDFNEEGIIKVLYNGSELASYKMDIYSLSFSSKMDIDLENKFVKYVDLGTTVEEFIDMITVVNGEVYILNSSGKAKEMDDVLCTGDVLKVYFKDRLMDEYWISVVGDFTGDGILDLNDLSQFKNYIVDLENNRLNDIFYESLDLNEDKLVDIADLAMMENRLKGNYDE